jgi:outer membrane protein OmpA-like peptidoglycan-associated protein
MYRVAIVLSAVLVMAAAIIFRDDLAQLVFEASLPSPGVTSPSITKAERISLPRDALSPAAAPPALARGEAKDADQPESKFDVVRIDPEGASVFAGRAPPNSQVTILANGRPVAEAKADDSGAWAAVTERGFAPAEYQLSLRAKPADGGAATDGQRVRLAVAPTARKALPAPAREVASARAVPAARAAPAPITFVYNAATFTSEGWKAADLLAKYLASQRPAAVSLSGHADERGSDRYNMELSRQRLDAVAGYLRENGFAGKLELTPKGKSEPYAGIDRRSLPIERAFELDRRVELRLTR